MKMKRCCAWLLAVLLLLAAPALPAGTLLAPITARAATQQSGDYVYTLRSDGTAAITEYKGRKTADLKLPSTLGGKKVTVVGNTAFISHDELKTVTVPAGVKTIGGFAFGYCYNLKSVSLPVGLKDIGRGAFNGCDALTAPRIPSTVTYVGSMAFGGTGYDKPANYKNGALYLDGWMLGTSNDIENLTAFQIPAGTVGLADFVFFYTQITGVQLPASLRYIGDSAFGQCSQLQTIQVAAGNTALSVQDNVLYNAAKTCLILFPQGKTDITNFTAPSTLTAVGNYAFSGNTTIQSVTLPNTVTKLGDQAFGGCEALEKMPLPTALKEIGANCFMYCGKLENVTLPAGITALPDGVFENCAAFTAISLPSGLKSIGENVFYGCEKITEMNIPNTVTTIGQQAFTNCTALAKVTLPDGLKVIPDRAFDSCEALKSITLPSTLTEIGYAAFQYTGLESIYVPDGVTEIRECAFQYSKLVSARLPEGLTVIRAHAFDGLPLEQINIPSTVKILENSAFAGAHFTTIELPAGLQQIWERVFSTCRQLTSITIPDGVTLMGGQVFENCNALTAVHLPKSMQRLGTSVFQACRSLTSITIPEGVTEIGSNAFNSCVKLTSVQFPSTLKSIDDTAFGDCWALTDIALPDGLEKLGDLVFSGTNIADTPCPDRLKQVGYNPFYQAPLSAAQPSEGIYWGDWLIGYEDCKGNSVDTVNIKDGTRHLADHVLAPTIIAGYSNYYMKYIDLPASLESIGDGALSYNSFTSLTIPGSVKTIGNYAFSNCQQLKTVTFSEGVQSLGDYVFSGCGLLTGVDLPATLQHMGTCVFINTPVLNNQAGQPIQYVDKWVIAANGTGNLSIANGTVGICDFAFYNNRNGQITVPASVKYLGEQCMGYRQDGAQRYPFAGFKMACYANSAAHTYAKKYGVNYTLICNHQYKSGVTKATTAKDGQSYKKCALCGAVTGKTVIAKASNIKLNKTAYTYNGKVQRPGVTVKDSKGKTLKNGTDYTVSYSSGCKNVGRYTVKVTLKGNYSGSKAMTYNINPKGTSVSKVTAAKKGFKVTWKKQATQTTGYEVQYSTSSNFKKGNKTVNVTKNKTTSKSVSKLSAKKKYYVRVRTYKTVKIGGKSVKLYSGWSKAKSVTTKK